MDQPRPTFGETVRRWRKRVGLTQKELAEACGVSRNYLVMIEKGSAAPPSDRVIDALERALGIGQGQLAWVAHLQRAAQDVRQAAVRSNTTVKLILRAFVEGELETSADIDLAAWLSEHAPDVVGLVASIKQTVASGTPLEEALMQRPFDERHRIAKALALYSPRGAEHPSRKVDELRRAISERRNAGARPVTPLRWVPLLSHTAAGVPAEFTDGDYPAGVGEEYVPVPPELTDPNAFALRVEGDSMAPALKDRDIVIVEPNVPVSEGMKVVAKTADGQVTCKILKELSERTVLASQNERYEDQVYATEEIQWIYPVVMSIRNELPP